jgi:hypothetical protein
MPTAGTKKCGCRDGSAGIMGRDALLVESSGRASDDEIEGDSDDDHGL